jgi:hypothetical protein
MKKYLVKKKKFASNYFVHQICTPKRSNKHPNIDPIQSIQTAIQTQCLDECLNV